MVPDYNRIYSLCKDIFAFRERLVNEIPEICAVADDLADHVSNARNALNVLYRDLDTILLIMEL